MLLAIFLAAAVTVTETDQPVAVRTQTEGAVRFPIGPDGRRLYVFDGDEGGPGCDEECRQYWRPLAADAGDMELGDWKPQEMPAGHIQWTFRNRPVYLESPKLAEYVSKNRFLAQAWHVLEYTVTPPAIPVPPSAAIGRRGSEFAMVDYRGHTLYNFRRDGKLPACRETCLEVWPPLEAPALARPVGDWMPVDRPDGVRQWAFRKKLVYTFSDDLTPEEARGADAGGVWQMVTLKPGSGKATKPSDKAKRITDRRITP